MYTGECDGEEKIWSGRRITVKVVQPCRCRGEVKVPREVL